MNAMPTKEDCARAAKVTEALAKERFPPDKIVRVEVELDDYDYDDPTLWITVVLDTPVGVLLDLDASIKFKGDLRPKLEEDGIFAFPVVIYESIEEVEYAV